MKIFLNIICVTYGKGDIYKRLLESVLNESFINSRLDINFILIDQNKADDYFKHQKYGSVNFEIIGSSQNGISLAKNLGLARIKNGYVWFLDDDCIIPKGTFNKIVMYLNRYKNGISFIADNFEGNPFRIWPKKIHSYNFFFTWYLSFTINSIFPYKKGMHCDLNLGLPQKYGSCEDVDFSIRYFKKLVYVPVTLVIHDDQKNYISYEKIYKYALGFGYLCRKHSPIGILFLFVRFAVLTLNLIKDLDMKKFFYALKGQLIGFLRL